MAVPDQPRVGVLVLRIWLERDATGLRARIVEVEDLEEPEEVSRAASEVEEICRIVRDFVSRFLVTRA